MASYFPQRTHNDIKNYWNNHLKKKLKKLQTSLDGNLNDEFSGFQHISNGQGERRLQTDIHMARQELCDALSLEKSNNPLSKSKACTSVYPNTSGSTQLSSTYAWSIENVSRLKVG
ncbi:hypothetical protein AAC387_Pa02g0484 [Persea americana]